MTRYRRPRPYGYHPDLEIMGIPSSRTEVRDIVKAWLVVSVIFAILRTRATLGPNLLSLVFSAGFMREAMLAAITVGVGFLLHELAHKIAAQRYGCAAEFRSDDLMLMVALAASLLIGFVFIAPGATIIAGKVNREQSGKIAAAGPWTNLAIALFFAALWLVPIPIFKEVAGVGYLINTWLALFNMIPFFIFDGKKIWQWHKGAWIGTVLVCVLFIVAGSISSVRLA